MSDDKKLLEAEYRNLEKILDALETTLQTHVNFDLGLTVYSVQTGLLSEMIEKRMTEIESAVTMIEQVRARPAKPPKDDDDDKPKPKRKERRKRWKE